MLNILGTGIKFNQSISELFLGDNFLVPSDASTLSAMLKSNTTLQLLDVRNNMLQVSCYIFSNFIHRLVICCNKLSLLKLGPRSATFV